MYFVAMLIAGTLAVRADTTPAPLRLGELLIAVEVRNPGLSAARAESRAAQARVSPLSRPPDPRLQLGLMNRSLSTFGQRSAVAMDQLTLTQMIPVPGKLRAATAAARAGARAADANAEELRFSLRVRAADDFYVLDQMDRSIGVLGQTGSLLREVEALVRTKYSLGSGRQADVLRAQLELAKLEEELTVMRAMRSEAEARLNALLRRPAGPPFGAVIAPCLPDSLPTQATLLDAAGRDAAVVRGAQARLDAAQATGRGAALERWPDLELGVGYGQQPMAGGRGTERMVSLMVGATLPVWSGSRQGAMRREAAAMAQAAEAGLLAAESEVGGRIGELTASFERARRLRALYRGTVLPQARAAAAAALAAYRSGGSSLDSVLEDYLTASRYELELIRLDAEQGRAVAGLEALTALPLLQPSGVQP